MSEEQGGHKAGIVLADLERCFQTLPQAKRGGSLPADASYFALQPSSRLLATWDWLIRALSLYFFWEVPLNIAFRTSVRLGAPRHAYRAWQPPMWADWQGGPRRAGIAYVYTNNVLEGLLIIDMMLHCCRAFHNSKGSLIYDLKAIRTRYLSEAFFLDLVAALPLQTLVAFNGSVNAGYVAWLRLPKMIRIYRIIQLNASLQRQTGHVGVLTGILRLVPLLFCLTHIYACALSLPCFDAAA